MRYLLLFLVSVCVLQNAKAQADCSFKHLLIGHAYGAQDTSIQQWLSIKNNAEKIKNLSIECIFFLGDIMRDTSRSSLIKFSAIVDGFRTPIAYIKGNHDDKWYYFYHRGPVIDGPPQCWEKWVFNIEPPKIISSNNNIADTSPKKLKYYFVNIDTENPNENIDSIIKYYATSPTYTNIVFHSHRLIWAYSNPRYAHLVELTNSPKMHQLRQVVDFDFLNAQKDKKFYFFAGDLGVNIPLFYDKVGNVTMYATGCGGTENDNALLADFKRDTIITSIVHLGTANYTIEDYTLEKINQIPLRYETISPQQGLNGAKWPLILGIFALIAFALYMVVKPNE